ncbi:hypothetical protein CRBSH125_01940 [Afipia carboxidovorans]|nr:hypothetical protein CRBSH125_01940 [Afipia carboxidovorans]
MRDLEKVIQQPEFVHHLQRRRMHGVTAKIAEEIGMFLQNEGFDAGAAEEIAEHHPGRAAAYDAALHMLFGYRG